MKFLELIDNRFDELVNRLESFSNLNTHTYNLKNLDVAIDQLQEMFSELEPDEINQFELSPIDSINSNGEAKQLNHGKVLRLRKRQNAETKILLCGHYDTVYPKDHDFQKVTINGNKMMGPGVLDMKGGLMTMLYALLAYENSDIKSKIGWEVLIVSDEEVGSIASSSYLETSSRNNDIGLLYEPALPDGSIVKSRKGVGSYTMVFRGVSAHAGRAFNDGLNAFYGVSDFISWSKNMMDINKDLIINLGKVEGGGPNNVVPDLAIARFNARVSTKKQRTEFEHRLEIFNRRMRKKYPGTELYGKFTSPPKPYSAKAKQIVNGLQECAKQLNMPKIKLVATGGASDGNKLNGFGLPNIDSLGPIGDGMHSRDEYVLIDSIKQRTKLSALYLYNITKELR
jgi:glutamate carboxypeptidase